jgi:hypothetical protein
MWYVCHVEKMINALKGHFKLDPKLSAIAGKGEKGNDKKSSKKKTRRTH